MKKRRLNLVQRMWLCFASQIAMAICITTTCVAASVVTLRLTQETNRKVARLMPAIRQEINAEQDPVKLRQIANTLEDRTISDAEFWEWGVRFVLKMSAIFGFGLFVYSLSLGLFAYRLQCENREKELSS